MPFKRRKGKMNNKSKIIEQMCVAFSKSGNTKVANVARCFLNAKGRFCRVTMQPQPSDEEKRGGKQRVFLVNIGANYLDYERKHFGSSGELTEVGRKILHTKWMRGMISVCESVRDPKGRFTIQPRTIDCNKVESIRYGGVTFTEF